MGLARNIAENQRLRALLAEREALIENHVKLLAEREALLADQAKALADKDAQIEALKRSNEDLAQQLDLIRCKLAGRRNERYEDPRQTDLFVVKEPPPATPTPDDTPPEPAEPQPKPKRGVQKRRNPADDTHLPKRKLSSKIDPCAQCPRCNRTLRVIGVSTSHRYEWVPGHFEVLQIDREQGVCPDCPSEGVLVAPGPPFALPKAMCGNGLLARILVDKFADHLPLNRLAKRMGREGVEFSVATLCDWVAGAAKVLQRIADAVGSRLLRSSWLQADDTGSPVQDGTDGKLRKGRLWAVTDQQEVRYHFTDTKEGKHPAAFLVDFKGKLLLVDGGSEFNLLVENLGLCRAGCWSHLRRYFFDARHYHPNEARRALGTIRDLFAIEAGLVGASLETRREVRDRDARPLVEALFAWIDGLSLTTRPTSLLGKALTYARNGRDSFFRFLDHPELPMHNNRSELALRQPVVGRKNWLFAGSEGGAHAAATLYTLIGSCMVQAIDPLEYLTDVLSRIADHPVNRVHELTPLSWRLAREGGIQA